MILMDLLLQQPQQFGQFNYMPGYWNNGGGQSGYPNAYGPAVGAAAAQQQFMQGGGSMGGGQWGTSYPANYQPYG